MGIVKPIFKEIVSDLFFFLKPQTSLKSFDMPQFFFNLLLLTSVQAFKWMLSRNPITINLLY